MERRERKEQKGESWVAEGTGRKQKGNHHRLLVLVENWERASE